MSIKDENGTEIVTLSTIHAMAFRVLIWIGIIGSPVTAGMFWSMNERIASNSKDLSFHEWRIQALESRKSSGVSQSVNVGSADAVAADESAKTWLTTQDVAEREKVTDRTVINYIESGMIEPEPERMGKSWMISENYRIVPQNAEKCGNIDAD